GGASMTSAPLPLRDGLATGERSSMNSGPVASSWRRLADPGPIGVEPAEPSAEVRVPDVVPGVDGDSERTRVWSRQVELGDRASVQPAEPVAAQLRKPRGSIGRDGEGCESRGRGGNSEFLESSASKPADLVHAQLKEEDGAVGIDGDVAEAALTRRCVECP